MKREVYVISAVRTPIGKFLGTLKDTPNVDLAAIMMKGLLQKTRISDDLIDEVHLGCCTMAEVQDATAPVLARQALLKAGLTESTVSYTHERACTSGSGAIISGSRAIQLGEADIVIVGGSENMSRTPHIVRELRKNRRLGTGILEDPLFPLGYKDYNPVAVDAANVALLYGISREEQDQWAYETQMKCKMAQESQRFFDEIIPIRLRDKKGNESLFTKDEFPRPNTTMEKLKNLSTVYGSKTITPGNAPGLNDGSAGLLLASKDAVKNYNLRPIAKLIAYCSTADRPDSIASVPAKAIGQLLKMKNKVIEHIDLIEINEAFAAMPLVSTKILGDNDEIRIKQIREKTNVNGGSIALGHPVGASGARIAVTLIHELIKRGGGLGLSAICGGLAQGDGILWEVMK